MERTAAQSSSTSAQQIIQNFYTKLIQIVIWTRLRFTAPSLSDDPKGNPLQRRINKWFNLEMEDIDVFRNEIRVWRHAVASQELPQPLVVEVYLDISSLSPQQTLVVVETNGRRVKVDTGTDAKGKGRDSDHHHLSVGGDGGGVGGQDGREEKNSILLETWQLNLSPPVPNPIPELPAFYKDCIMFFRSLHSYAQLLPVHRLFRQIGPRIHSWPITIDCRLRSSPSFRDDEIGLDTALHDKDDLERIAHTFSVVQSPLGQLELSIVSRANCDFQVDDGDHFLISKFIDMEETFFTPSLATDHRRKSELRPSAGKPPLVRDEGGSGGGGSSRRTSMTRTNTAPSMGELRSLEPSQSRNSFRKTATLLQSRYSLQRSQLAGTPPSDHGSPSSYSPAPIFYGLENDEDRNRPLFQFSPKTLSSPPPFASRSHSFGSRCGDGTPNTPSPPHPAMMDMSPVTHSGLSSHLRRKPSVAILAPFKSPSISSHDSPRSSVDHLSSPTTSTRRYAPTSSGLPRSQSSVSYDQPFYTMRRQSSTALRLGSTPTTDDRVMEDDGLADFVKMLDGRRQLKMFRKNNSAHEAGGGEVLLERNGREKNGASSSSSSSMTTTSEHQNRGHDPLLPAELNTLQKSSLALTRFQQLKATNDHISDSLSQSSVLHRQSSSPVQNKTSSPQQRALLLQTTSVIAAAAAAAAAPEHSAPLNDPSPTSPSFALAETLTSPYLTRSPPSAVTTAAAAAAPAPMRHLATSYIPFQPFAIPHGGMNSSSRRSSLKNSFNSIDSDSTVGDEGEGDDDDDDAVDQTRFRDHLQQQHHDWETQQDHSLRHDQTNTTTESDSDSRDSRIAGGNSHHREESTPPDLRRFGSRIDTDGERPVVSVITATRDGHSDGGSSDATITSRSIHHPHHILARSLSLSVQQQDRALVAGGKVQPLDLTTAAGSGRHHSRRSTSPSAPQISSARIRIPGPHSQQKRFIDINPFPSRGGSGSGGGSIRRRGSTGSVDSLTDPAHGAHGDGSTSSATGGSTESFANHGHGLGLGHGLIGGSSSSSGGGGGGGIGGRGAHYAPGKNVDDDEDNLLFTMSELSLDSAPPPLPPHPSHPHLHPHPPVLGQAPPSTSSLLPLAKRIAPSSSSMVPVVPPSPSTSAHQHNHHHHHRQETTLSATSDGDVEI